MNTQRRLELAQQHILLLKLINNIKSISEDEKWAIDEIRSEAVRETAEQGYEKLDDLMSLLDDAVELFEESAQGDYIRILTREKQRQKAQRQQEITEQNKKQAAEEAVRQQEMDYFLTYVCPAPNNPNNFDIDSLDEYFDWKYQDTGRRDKYDDYIFEHTDAYKEYLKIKT